MRTIRRLYFYLVAFISLEVVMWSVITLARTLFDAATLNNIGDQIAGGLAFLIVGLPMFLFHWGFIQRDVQKDTDERSSRLREIFLYGVYLATLIPIAQNVIAIINRIMLSVFSLDNTFAFLGSRQTFQDNLIAMAVPGVLFLYFHTVTKSEWAANVAGNDLPDTRRFFRYIWMLYSLVLLVFGVVYIFEYIFFTPTGFGNPTREMLANGLALTLVSVPLWTYNWLVIQRSLTMREEADAYLRLVVLYTLTLGGIIATLFSAGWVISVILRAILEQEAITAGDLFNRLSSTLALAIPMGVIWAYFGSSWNKTIEQNDDPLRRSALRRLYGYVLALLGNISVFFAIQQLLGVLIDIVMGQSTGVANFADSISNALAMLILGLPVWLQHWPKLQVEAAASNETGDHARRSVIRKAYLYLAIFSLVVGIMASAGMLLYNLISTLTVENPGSPLYDFLHDSKTLSIIVIWLVYHFLALRGDGKAAQAALAVQHANFPVGILADGQTIDAAAIQENLQRIAPQILVTSLSVDILAEQNLDGYKALVLPAGLVTAMPAEIREKLDGYSGKRLVIPESTEGWVWQGLIQQTRLNSAKETARLIRLLAENQPIQSASTNNPLTIIAYVFAGIFALQIIFTIIAVIISAYVGL
jgi:hypothetical protein